MTTSVIGVDTAQLGRRAPGGGKVLGNPWGKGFENQPATWGKGFGKSQGGPHPAARVGAQAIPDQQDLLAPDVPLESPQERDEGDVGVTARAGLEVQAGASTIPAE